jgi:hypothetical protein
MEARTLIRTLKETKQHTYRAKPQGLPNLTKRNDENFEKQLKIGPMMWVSSIVEGKK